MSRLAAAAKPLLNPPTTLVVTLSGDVRHACPPSPRIISETGAPAARLTRTSCKRLAAHIQHCALKTDARGQRIFKERRRSTKTIDAAVASMMALDRARLYAQLGGTRAVLADSDGLGDSGDARVSYPQWHPVRLMNVMIVPKDPWAPEDSSPSGAITCLGVPPEDDASYSTCVGLARALLGRRRRSLCVSGT
jgi:hypothetical protein